MLLRYYMSLWSCIESSFGELFDDQINCDFKLFFAGEFSLLQEYHIMNFRRLSWRCVCVKLVFLLQDIRQAVSKLQSKLSAKVVPLTEGFKSMHS